MTTSANDASELVAALRSLAPWSDRNFSPSEWAQYQRVAALFTKASPDVVKTALSQFVLEAMAADDHGDEDESKPFILMRVLFDLPDRADAAELKSFKGWTNWPGPDAASKVNLGWPVRWSAGKPRLEATYEGSMGLPYAAAEEYDWLLQHRSFRDLEDV